MEIQPYEAAKAAFALRELSMQKMSFKAAYAVKRNLDFLGGYAEKYEADLKAKEVKTPAEFVAADAEIKAKWLELPKEGVQTYAIDFSTEGPDFQIAPDILTRISFLLKDETPA